MKYLYILQQALIWIVTIFWLYQMAVSFCSLIKLKEKKLIENKNHKFMAIIPAHNEEMVIKNLVESLREQDYPKDLYDIYVIADNCTDNTAEIAKEAGAIVILDDNFKSIENAILYGRTIYNNILKFIYTLLIWLNQYWRNINDNVFKK